MTQISHEDYENKRIYLHEDTGTEGFAPDLMQQEHRERRRLNANNERNFTPMITFRGNEAKGGDKFTPKLTNLETGVRIIPYDRDQNLKIKNELVCIDDGISNQGCFDRLPVLSNIDIDVDYSPIEIVKVATGSGVTDQDKTDIVNQVWGYDRDA